MEEYRGAILIENGSYNIKYGYCGDDKPEENIRSIICKNSEGKTLIGNEALNHSILTDGEGLVKEGLMKDVEQMQLFWEYIFSQSTPEYLQVMLTEATNNPLFDRKKACQLLFEKYGVEGLYMIRDQILSIYSTGRTDGLVIDMGYERTKTVSIFKGYCIHNTLSQNYFAGAQLTDYLIQLLRNKNIDFRTVSQRETANKIKEELLKLKSHKHAEIPQGSVSYELPDGKMLTLDNSEIYRCAEALFEPSLAGSGTQSVGSLLRETVEKTCEEARREICASVGVFGGSSMVEGMVVRAKNEIEEMDVVHEKTKIFVTEERANSTWIGGSILGSLSCFVSIWLRKDEYEEYGPEAINRKCFN